MIPEPIRAQAVLGQLGHVATTQSLLQHLTAREIAEAVERKHIFRLAQGRYGLRSAHEAQRAAMQLSGTASHLSAAQLHGWPIARPPRKPWVTLPRNRNVGSSARAAFNIVRAQASGSVTDPLRTVLDCARRLPFGEALAVADSALREGDVDEQKLVAAAEQARGPGVVQCRRVAREVSSLAANPFESCTRAITLDVGLRAEPQVAIDLPGRTIHPDLVDVRRRLVIEADSYLHHMLDIRVFEQDLWRYTALVVDGWTVLRFGYHHVMQDPDWVAECLATYR